MAPDFDFMTSTEGFPSGKPLLSNSKESDCSAGDLGWIPGSGRSPGEGNSNLLQCSCLGNPIDGGAWQAMRCQRVGHD